jgi:predicted GNAT family N-acyltransferase
VLDPDPVSKATVRLAADKADRAAAYAVRHEVFVAGQGVPFDLERDDLDDSAAHVVAVVDGRVVGAGRLVIDEETGVLGRLAVLDAARGTGLGVALVGLIEATARDRGCRSVELHAQVPVRGFYEQLGYTAAGAEYEEAGIPHITMCKSLHKIL